MEEDIRLRAACDRCHSQKVRCPKEPDEESCSRCIKAKVPCKYSPFREKKPLKENLMGSSALVDSQTPVPKEAAAICENGSEESHKRKRPRPEHDAEEDHNNGTENDLAWPLDQSTIDDSCPLDWTLNSFSNFGDSINNAHFDLGFDGQSLLMPIEVDAVISRYGEPGSVPNIDPTHPGLHYPEENTSQLSILGVERNVSHLNAAVDKESIEETVKNCIRELSKLNIELLEHRQTIPPQSIYEGRPLDSASMKKLSKQFSKFKIEETMCLTERLISIYPTFTASCINGRPSQSLPVTPPMDWDSPISGESPSDRTTSSASSSVQFSPKPALDHASIMLILSCHLRLIDIYDEIFAHTAHTVEMKAITRNEFEYCMDGPQVKIGNYAPSSTYAASMQMLLLVQFTSQLFDHAATLVEEIKKAEPCLFTVSTFNESTSAMTRVAAENVKRRASHMSQELGNMRRLMTQNGLLA